MIQYTDVPMTLTVTNATFLTAREIIVSLRQKTACANIRDVDVIDDTHLSLTLTQAQSGQFSPSQPCELQVNFVTADGARRATNIATIPVMANLYDRVVADE